MSKSRPIKMVRQTKKGKRKSRVVYRGGPTR